MPTVELFLAIRALQDQSQPAQLRNWRRQVHGKLSTDARLVMSMMPSAGNSPSFGAPALMGVPENVMEKVGVTPRTRLREDLAPLAGRQPLPWWARHMADDPSHLKRLHAGLASLYELLVAPHWKRLTRQFAAERAVRMRQVISGGVERMLTQADPRWLRWNPPVLEIRTLDGAEHDLYLRGRGILLVPSWFLTRVMVGICTDPPILCYPASQDGAVQALTTSAPGNVRSRTETLLGQTRATVLATVAEHPACSTKELAALTDIAPASASEHATVLREAGLICTVRHRNSVLHSPTELGIALLNGPAA